MLVVSAVLVIGCSSEAAPRHSSAAPVASATTLSITGALTDDGIKRLMAEQLGVVSSSVTVKTRSDICVYGYVTLRVIVTTSGPQSSASPSITKFEAYFRIIHEGTRWVLDAYGAPWGIHCSG